MKTFEERFTAWVDGVLPEDELVAFKRELAAHPELAGDRTDALKLRGLLRRHPTAPVLSNPNFFNLRIQQQIAASAPRIVERKRLGFSFWKLPRLAWAGACCLLIAGGLYRALIPEHAVAEGTPYFAQVVEAWPADPGISATTVYNPHDNVTVLWLDGLDPLPATYKLQ